MHLNCIISSSPRHGGNSDILCDEFMRGAQETNDQVENLFLKDKHVNYCTGCSVCSMYSKPCPQKDDANEVVESGTQQTGYRHVDITKHPVVK